MSNFRIRYVFKNKNTGDSYQRTQHISEVELGLHKLFDIENYEIISRKIIKESE